MSNGLDILEAPLSNSKNLRDLPAQFDYRLLIHFLADYSNKRDKIRSLLSSGDIVRIKKGIYILGSAYKSSANLLVLANMIYGPSYVSMESALSFYGAIPESVPEIQSVNPKKGKVFDTPIGTFRYHKTSMEKYSYGINLVDVGDQTVLMASPEKALMDLVASKNIRSVDEIGNFLDGLRIEADYLRSLNQDSLDQITVIYASPGTTYLNYFLKAQND